MTTKVNAKNLRQYKKRVSFIVEQILAFSSNTNLVIEVRNLPQNLERISQRCVTLQTIFIQTSRSTL